MSDYDAEEIAKLKQEFEEAVADEVEAASLTSSLEAELEAAGLSEMEIAELRGGA